MSTSQEIKSKVSSGLSQGLEALARASQSLAQRLSSPNPLDKEQPVPRLVSKSLDSPDETREFDKGKLEVVDGVGRATFQPGWKWSECLKPIVGGDSCQAAHAAYFISGQMHVVMDDGTEADYGPGDYMLCDPGHDAWIVGDEPCVVLDWAGYANYAKA
jgi:hypothetical protein